MYFDFNFDILILLIWNECYLEFYFYIFRHLTRWMNIVVLT
jgi:hypothetical protein